MDWSIERLVADRWIDTVCIEERVLEPGIGDVDAAIDALDGSVHTMACLYGSEDLHLTVGGGPDLYIVSVARGDDEFWCLLGNAKAQGVCLLNTGGQEGEFPQRHVVDKQAVVRSVHYFFDRGGMDPVLEWEKT